MESLSNLRHWQRVVNTESVRACQCRVSLWACWVELYSKLEGGLEGGGRQQIERVILRVGRWENESESESKGKGEDWGAAGRKEELSFRFGVWSY